MSSQQTNPDIKTSSTSVAAAIGTEMKEALRSDLESLSSGPDPNLGASADTGIRKDADNINVGTGVQNPASSIDVRK